MIIDALHLHAECVNARKQLQARRADLAHIVEGMAGRASQRNDGSVQRLIENHYHQYVALVVPRMVSGDPRAKVTTPRGGMAKLKALFGELGVNEWIRQTQHRSMCQRLATDAALGWGLGLMSLEKRSSFGEDDDDPSAWVSFDRLDQGDGWWDPLATSWQKKAFAGYHYATTRDELLERARNEPGWNAAKIKSLPLDTGLEEIDRPKDAPRRGEIVLREMWVSGFRLPNAPKDSNGTIFTLGVSLTGGEFVREPQPFFGPGWGPLYLYDIYYVPGQALGMSPCEAVMAQVEEFNTQANKLSMAIAARKKFLLGKKMDVEDVKTILEARDGGAALMLGYANDLFKEAEIGGPSPAQVASIDTLADRLYRNSGLDDAARGLAQDPGVTATATATASASSGMRTGYVAQRFADCDEQVLRGVHWYLCHSRAIKIHIDPEEMGITPEFLEERNIDPKLLMQMEATFRGGPDEGYKYEDFHLSLDRYSMERVSEGLMQQRTIQWAQMQMQLAQLAPAIASYTDVRQLSKAIDDAFNRSSAGDVIDPDKAAEMAGKMAMQQELEDADEQLPGVAAGQQAMAGAA